MNSRLLLVGALVVLPSCATVRVAPVTATVPDEEPARLSVHRLVAYGDAMAEGLLHGCPDEPVPVSRLQPTEPAKSGVRNAPPSGVSYPARLQELLTEHYPGQPIEIINEGVGGAEVEADAAQLGRILIGDAPDVLLLTSGVHSINQQQGEAISRVVQALRAMIREAKARSVTVMVGTMLPQREGGCRADDYLDNINDIILANAQIRTMVGEEGAILVDLYQAFNGRTATLIGPDGLHPSADGYLVIARTFFDAIVRTLQEE